MKPKVSDLNMIPLVFEEFNAELALEVYTFGAMYHNRGCEEIRTLSNVSELLAQSKMKIAFGHYKQAASVFEYIE